MGETRQINVETRGSRTSVGRGMGAPISPEHIRRYLAHLEEKGRVSGTLDWYARGLKRLYHALPEGDKHIRRGSLETWRDQLVKEGYAPSTINEFIVVANGYLEFVGAREFQVVEHLTLEEELQPELSRTEYLRLLQTARALGRERTYLLVKVFGNSELPVQELPKVTVEAVREGRVNVSSKGIRQVIRFPECVRKELLAYAEREKIQSGPIFLTRKGEPMSRTNVNTGIGQLCLSAQVPEEKGNPRCLKRLYQTTREGIQRNIALLVEQAQERLLEEEQLSVGWEEQ